MSQEHTELTDLKEIRQLLSHLHGEISSLEESYQAVLLVLQKFEGVADLDDLTGLMRRRAFFQRWETLLKKCATLGETCGVVMIDVDHFKSINDRYGHATGDDVLRKVGNLLKQFESPRCFSGRLGGEEFAMVVQGTAPEVEGVAELIRRQAERMSGPIRNGSGDWGCTVSLGVSVADASAEPNPQDLLQKADEALYQAKRNGRNQVKVAG